MCEEFEYRDCTGYAHVYDHAVLQYGGDAAIVQMPPGFVVVWLAPEDAPVTVTPP